MKDQIGKEDTKDKNLDREDQYLNLVLDIAGKQFEYKIERRPVIWYRNIIITALILILLGIGIVGILGDNTYYGGWATLITIILAIIFIGMVIFFFLDPVYWGGVGFDGIFRIKNILSSKEEIEKLQIQQRLIDEYKTAHRPPKHKVADEVSQIIQQYTSKANRNRRLYYSLQMFIIFCSLLVTGLTSGLNTLVKFFSIPWITPAISFTVTFLTAMITLFRFRERSHNQQQTADALQYEISCAIKGIYGYKKLSEEDAYTK